MVICKYFQQGNCRYGKSCKFEHVYASKYSYHANPSTQGGVTDEQLANQVKSDVESAIKGGQWILSSYAPFKEKPCLPGLIELSPEEARLFIYEAKAQNKIDEATSYINNLFKEAKCKYDQLIHPTQDLIKLFRSLYKGEPVSSPFNSMQNFGPSNSNASSLFRSAIQNKPAFGQNNSIFSQSNNNGSAFGQTSQSNSVFSQGTANVFGPSDTSNAKSIFAQASQNTFATNQPSFGQTNNAFNQSNNAFGQTSNVFSQSPPQQQFGGQEPVPKSLFSQANQNLFSSNQNQQNASNLFAAASQSAFGMKNEQTMQQSPFNSSSQSTDPFNNNCNQTIFGKPVSNVFEQPVVEDSKLYSNMEDLSQEDLEAFKSDEFILGFVPDMPPPRELCA